MAILAGNGGRMRDYKVPNPIPKSGPPLVAIPTTAGTGSEVTKFTVITDTETDEKMLIGGVAVTPTAAIVDYELTLSCPMRLTADTGIDTLTHAIEALVSRKAGPFTDDLAKAAMKRVARSLRTACREPHNHEARADMMLAATEAGMAFDKPAGRIVEAYAHGAVQTTDVRRFYRQTLPQLGWQRLGRDRFAREDEELEIDYLGADGDLTVRYTLQPR